MGWRLKAKAQKNWQNWRKTAKYGFLELHYVNRHYGRPKLLCAHVHLKIKELKELCIFYIGFIATESAVAPMSPRKAQSLKSFLKRNLDRINVITITAMNQKKAKVPRFFIISKGTLTSANQLTWAIF